MAFTDINSEDRLIQKTFAEHLQNVLGWESVYAWNEETFGPDGTLGRTDTREVVLARDLRAALARLNPQLPPAAIAEAVQKMTRHDFSRSLIQQDYEVITADDRLDKLAADFVEHCARAGVAWRSRN